jgi:hypothetical protein
MAPMPPAVPRTPFSHFSEGFRPGFHLFRGHAFDLAHDLQFAPGGSRSRMRLIH